MCFEGDYEPMPADRGEFRLGDRSDAPIRPAGGVAPAPRDLRPVLV